MCQPIYRNLLWAYLILLSYSSTYAFQVKDSSLVTLSVKDTPMETVLMMIEDQTRFKFVYDTSVLPFFRNVHLRLKNASITQTLDRLLKEGTLRYVIKSNVISIREKEAIGGTERQKGKRDIAGTVTSVSGEPLQGATVKLKGGIKGTVTDNEGGFILKDLPANATIEISFTGYKTRLLDVNKDDLFIQLEESINMLDEQAVIGYGVSPKRNLTGSVNTVKADDIIKQPVIDLLTAMSGLVSGMLVTQTSGIPGAVPTVRIRGLNSISNGNEPYIIIDQMPVSATSRKSISAITGGMQLYINPADIETISVLKDADATSIYGSRAANGVVLVTTKKGQEGKTKADFSFYRGIETAQRKMKLLETPQYLQMRREAFANDTMVVNTSLPDAYDLAWGDARNTDWQEVLIGGIAHSLDAHASVSGGSHYTQFRLSGGFHQETTVFPGDFLNRRLSLQYSQNYTSLNDKFQLSFSGGYFNDDNKLPQSDLTGIAMGLPPNAPDTHDAMGRLNWEKGTFANPFAYLLRTYSANAGNFLTNSILRYQLINGLLAKVSLGFNNTQKDEVIVNPQASYFPGIISNKRFSQFSNFAARAWLVEPQLIYEVRKLGINVLFGTSFYHEASTGDISTASGFASDAQLLDIRSAADNATLYNAQNVYRYNSIFGRVNYNYKDRYMVTLNGRRDGSSRFGPGRRYANFGSIGIAWVLSEEGFLEDHSVFSFAKLRASVGTTGNDQIADYGYMNMWVPTANTYADERGLTTNRLYNPDFAWEKNKKYEVTGEVGFFEDRLYMSVCYFDNRSGNQLVASSLPATTGFSTINMNAPITVRNNGLELELIAVNIKNKHFRWTTKANLTIAGNELISFSGTESSTLAKLYSEGYPLTIKKSYRVQGVNPQNGVYEFIAGDNRVTDPAEKDKDVITSLAPAYYGGLSNNITYRECQLDFTFQFVKQNGTNYLEGFSNPPGSAGNQPVAVLGRWRNVGDVTSIEKFTQNRNSPAYQAYSIFSSSGNMRYSDASFIRLKNVMLSFSVPERIIKKTIISHTKIYFKGQNLLMFTTYKGLDPELQSASKLPPLCTLTTGIQITL